MCALSPIQPVYEGRKTQTLQAHLEWIIKQTLQMANLPKPNHTPSLMKQAIEEICMDHHLVVSGSNFRASFHMSSFMSSSLREACSKSKLKGEEQTGSSFISWRLIMYGWFNASSTACMWNRQKNGWVRNKLRKELLYAVVANEHTSYTFSWIKNQHPFCKIKC